MTAKLPDIAFLRRVADAAAAETMTYFRSSMGIENKYEIGFDPVTEGDKKAEAAIRALIEAEYPEHGILGEEYGSKNTDRSHVWIIDPIDGTRAFISGVPVWGTLVGLTVDGVARCGFMDQPYTREFYVADGEKSWLIEAGGTPKQLSTRKNVGLKDAMIFTTSPFLYQGAEREGLDRLTEASRLMRFGTDCYGAAMVASGNADILIESGLQPYDIVALIPIIEQAGGVITRIDGARAESGGTILAAGSVALHAEAMGVFLG